LCLLIELTPQWLKPVWFFPLQCRPKGLLHTARAAPRAHKTKTATLRVAACGNFMMCSLFLHCLHTIRFAAPHKEVAVTKGEAKSVGVHAGQIVVCELPECQGRAGATKAYEQSC